jgi:hypothetical protein
MLGEWKRSFYEHEKHDSHGENIYGRALIFLV